MGVLKVEQVELVLSPVSDSLPFGADYTDESLKADGEVLGRIARFFEKSSPSQGDGTRVDDRSGSWADETLKTAIGFLRHTKDLRAVVRLAQAAMVKGGLEGLVDGLELLATFAKVYWAGMHPAEGADGGYEERIAILSNISGAFEDWEALPLVAGSSVATLGALMKHEELAKAAVERATTAKAIASLVLVERAQAALADLAALTREKKPRGAPSAFNPDTCRGHPHTDYSPGPLLKFAAQILVSRLSAGAAANAGNGTSSSGKDAESNGAGAKLGAISVKSRADVGCIIDAIQRYYADNDVSSPIPNLLQRCKRLSSASFDEIIADMLPEQRANSEAILGPTVSPPARAAATFAETPMPGVYSAAPSEPLETTTIAVNTREEVVGAIEALCAYYEKNDISSPLPILLRRCQRLATKTFDEIIDDLMPGQRTSIDKYRGVGSS